MGARSNGERRVWFLGTCGLCGPLDCGESRNDGLGDAGGGDAVEVRGQGCQRRMRMGVGLEDEEGVFGGGGDGGDGDLLVEGYELSAVGYGEG